MRDIVYSLHYTGHGIYSSCTVVTHSFCCVIPITLLMHYIYMQCSCQHPGAPLGCSGPVPQRRSDSSGTQKEWSTALGGSGQAARLQQSSGYDSYQCHREAGEHDEFKGVKWHLLFQESPRGNDRGNGTPRHPQRAEYRSRIWGNC